MTWLSPIAFAGLAALAIPIVIHLLTRQQGRRLPFPSLRFLQATPLAALKRRTLQDRPLLAVRLLMLAAAVAALAGPVVRWPGREARWASRVSRAVVVEPGFAGQGILEPVTAFREATFARADARAALADAVRWLEAQPPSAREIVLQGRFRRGWISDADLAAIPAHVGIAVSVREAAAPREQPLTFFERRDGALYRVVRSMTLGDQTTAVREIAAERVDTVPITVTASAADRSAADAALNAILTRGVMWSVASTPERPAAERPALTIPWPGSAAALGAAIDRATDVPLDPLEPARVPAGVLARWARPPGPPPADAVPADEGDRRYFWALALVLLAVEWRLRGRRVTGAASPAAQEARVA